jgi:hypothetical protein
MRTYRILTKKPGMYYFKFNNIGLFNIRGRHINSLAVVPSSPSTQARIIDPISVSDLQTNSLLSQAQTNGSLTPQQQTEVVLNMVDNDLSRVTIGSRGVKRSIESSDLSVSGHLDKKVLKQIPQDNEESINILYESTQNWVNKTFDIAQVSEESKIPDNYSSEPVARADDLNVRITDLNVNYQNIKAEAYELIDEMNTTSELLKMYMDDIFLRVRERNPSSFSDGIDYDSTFDSDSEMGINIPDNKLGVNLPTDSENQSELSRLGDLILNNAYVPKLVRGNSNDASSVSNNSNDTSLVPDNLNDTNLVPNNLNDTNLVPGNTITSPINPELADNPELTVHYETRSNDDVLSINISTDISDPHLGVGLEPLNSGLQLKQVTYSGMLREDNVRLENFVINMRGEDTMEYRIAYDYLIDTINHLENLISKYQILRYFEEIVFRWNPELIDMENHIIFSEIHNILDLVSQFN